MDDGISGTSRTRERFPLFHLFSLILGLLIATGGAMSMDAPPASHEVPAAVRPPRAPVRGGYLNISRQPVNVYIVDSQSEADTLEHDAAAEGLDDEGNGTRPGGPREYLIGGSAQADAEIEETIDYLGEINETSESSGTGTLYRLIDLRRR